MKGREEQKRSNAKLQRTGCTGNPILHSLSAAERLCHLPFQPTACCVTHEDANLDSSFVRAGAKQLLYLEENVL